MEIERLKEVMQSYSIYPTCANCGYCAKHYAGNGASTYTCQATMKGLRFIHKTCDEWMPSTNMRILFDREEVKKAAEPAMETDEQKVQRKLEERRLRDECNEMRGRADEARMELKKMTPEIEKVEKQLEPLDIKISAVAHLIAECEDETLLPYYYKQKEEHEAVAFPLIKQLDELYERAKELQKVVDKYEYWVPEIKAKSKEEFVRPQTLMEGIKEDMPTLDEIERHLSGLTMKQGEKVVHVFNREVMERHLQKKYERAMKKAHLALVNLHAKWEEEDKEHKAMLAARRAAKKLIEEREQAQTQTTI